MQRITVFLHFIESKKSHFLLISERLRINSVDLPLNIFIRVIHYLWSSIIKKLFSG